ncbi:TPA: DUF1310 family protein [Streptococcus suis]|uniref:DUF1310 family protein n=2 Tax=Streptococcus suis TaxID=1307 RepID=A0A142UPH0_STRSU|nr:DUF1310 family protein [Streptococcus suis]AER16506.1 protein of unknown function DUF1310 [Streptococcus suis D9]AHF58727.1 putative secreted protein [Streptococcus suis 05HAS68]ALA27950.1 hypothetical protein AA105_01290 [Streptococcus suis]AML47345.1 hypothetical protein APQ97_09920 [Streptococcus suis]AMU79378.1 hypothetical protein AN924_08700 [Streptococcus suis]
MKIVVKILVGILIAIAIGIGGFKLMQKIEHDQMVEIVKGEEVRKMVEERLISYDAKALTEEGIIRSYSIDSASIRRNPMGGINFSVYLNNDDTLYINYRIEKIRDDIVKLVGGGKSSDLTRLLGEEANE